MRLLVALIFVALSGVACYLFLNNRAVNVIAVHYDGNTAQVLVDRLPFTDSARINWWQHSQGQIRKKYNIPNGEEGPFFITIYDFGDGYKEEGKEDRRCFSDVKPPRNCIDKNILMMIRRTRDGNIQYDF
ncbi:DUF943 family protein [Brenneria goodwinii]|uniref:DUF943 family protein n=1 Tax=Brenneria goodwinii TaxID=1109412 RepID=UPI0036E5878E